MMLMQSARFIMLMALSSSMVMTTAVETKSTIRGSARVSVGVDPAMGDHHHSYRSKSRRRMQDASTIGPGAASIPADKRAPSKDDSHVTDDPTQKSKEEKKTSSKKSKKEKEACKKAKSQPPKKSKNAEKSSKSVPDGGGQRLLLPHDDPVGDRSDNDDNHESGGDVPYCSHGDWDAQQCANMDSIPYSGRHQSLLEIELIHNSEQDVETITQQTEAALHSDSTQARFVGCSNMTDRDDTTDDRRHRRRATSLHLTDGHLQYQYHRSLAPGDTSDHEIIYKTQSERIIVTGVDFYNLDIMKDGCQSSPTLNEGTVCDAVTSNVDIFYFSSDGSDPTDEDRADMQNLLVETLLNQAEAGIFYAVGSVENVYVEGVGGSESGGGDFIGYAIGGLVVVGLVLASIYCLWYKKSDPEDSMPDAKAGKIDETSDEEEHTSDEDEGRQGDIPVAQVVAVEDVHVSKKRSDTKAHNNDNEPQLGGWFEWVSSADGTDGKNKKKKETTDLDKKNDEGVASWW